ncbi:hypothetical protein VTK73DRAFT_5327 [Phialemonium thermophilum]|uniref:Beta-lactamase-related domain-containing protein n=1 Tax=Phialemonium thermophilum TaxID=223376 RepID=A0ABR3Y7B4_9PEZI
MASDFEAIVKKAVESREIAGAVFLAADKSGKFQYSGVFGYSSLEPGAEKTLQDDALFTLMSGTKLITTICALQVVEDGKIGLDDDVSSLLPSLAAQPVLVGFADDGAPQFEPRRNPITLRHLLTHSSGVGYQFMDPDLARWAQVTGRPDVWNSRTSAKLEETFDSPLLFQPGEGWRYGAGVDWAGRVVEVLTGQSLEDHVRERILKPLGVDGLSFFPERRPELASRLFPTLPVRSPETGKIVHGAFQAKKEVDCKGGHGLHGDVKTYLRVLQSLLADDGVLLKSETVAAMSLPQLTPASKKELLQITKDTTYWVGYFPETEEWDFGLGGLLVDGDGDEYRKRGALLWGGMYNMSWILDRKAGVCAVVGTQFLPTGDFPMKKIVHAFEQFVYANAQA